MPRPRHCRRVTGLPHSSFYKPSGIPMRLLEAVNLTVDELEAVRLADLEGLYQETAADKMRVSRQTFGRILESAHKKIADALVNGKALSIEGGNFQLDTTGPPQGPPPDFGPARRRGRGRGRGYCGGRGMDR